MVNRPKVNRELTIEELKVLLSKAEEANQEKNVRISALEQAVESLGGAPLDFSTVLDTTLPTIDNYLPLQGNENCQ
jgi:hypothetical protein